MRNRPSVERRLSGARRRVALGRAEWTAIATTAVSALALGAGPAPALAADTCPNATVRAQQKAENLPDCRAYERVSPAAKGNGDVSYYLDSGSSASGDGLVFGSVAGFADPAGNARANSFLARRGSGEWPTHSLTPRQAPDYLAPFFHDYVVLDYSADLSAGILANGSDPNDPDAANTTKELYRQDTATRSNVLISPLPAVDPGPFAYQPSYLGASTDFRHVAFQSSDPRTPDSPAGASSYLYVWDDGTPRLVGGGLAADGVRGVSAATGGVLRGGPGGNPLHRSMSPDGSQLVFASGSPSQLWLDERGSQPRQISLTQPAGDVDNTGGDPAPNGAVFQGSLAENGKLKTIFFTSQDALTADARVGDESSSGYTSSELYAYDVASKSLRDVVPDHAPGHDAGAVVDQLLAASTDGAVLYFTARRDLVPGSPNDDSPGLYRLEQGQLIVSMGAVPKLTGSDQAWYQKADMVWASADGRRFAILTGDRLAGPPTTTNPDSAQSWRRMNVYTVGSGWDCVSCRPDGQPTKADTRFRGVLPGPNPENAPRTRVVSEDGRRVFFETDESLVDEDVNGVSDVYMWDGGARSKLISSGRGFYDSHFLDASASGDDVFIATQNQLVGSDRDDNIDAYDVRVDGGFLEEAAGRPCAGGECQGGVLAAPGLMSAGSASFVEPSGPGSPERLGKPKVSKVKTVLGTSTRIAVTVPAKGRISVSGSGLQRASTTATKAGKYRVTVKLSGQARRTLKRKRQLAVRITVRFIPANGSIQSVQARATFKSKNAPKGR